MKKTIIIVIILAAAAVSAADRFTRSEANTQVMYTDAVTKLTWTASVTSGKGWIDAIDFCNTLNYGGQSDWRLPSVKELASLINYGKNPPVAVPFTLGGTFWSSTANKVSSSEDSPWAVDFDAGLVTYGLTAGTPRNVLCVRN